MTPEERAQLGLKIQAARELGLEIKQTHSYVGNSFFTTVEFEKDGTTVFSHPVAADKDATVKSLEDERAMHEARIADIDKEIADIGKLKPAIATPL